MGGRQQLTRSESNEEILYSEERRLHQVSILASKKSISCKSCIIALTLSDYDTTIGM